MENRHGTEVDSPLRRTDHAAALGVTRTTLSELVNGKRGISPEMAVRLSKVFGGTWPQMA